MTPIEAAKALRRHQPALVHPAAAALPRRPRQVLERLLAGDSEKQIARRLDLSHHTIHDYVKHVYRHFQVSSRAELLALFVSTSPGLNTDEAAVNDGNGNGHSNGNGHPHAHEPGGAAELHLPGRSSSEEERVLYCVQLLARKGFIVRWTEAATQLIHRRRGVAASIVVGLLCLVGTFALRMDSQHHGLHMAETAGHAAPVMEVVRRLEVGPPRDGAWLDVGRAELWQQLEWRTDPPEAEAYLTVGNQLLEPGQAHLMDAPGTIQVRVPEGIPPMVYITISRLADEYR